jgi:myo-inositol-1(or 4)-monophosphatase
MTYTADNLNTRFELANSLAVEAGALALDYFNRRHELTIETKRDAQDVVSIADRNVEIFLREAVAKSFPEDGFLGEEFGHTVGSSGFTWVVDPIDGTSPFVNGMPNWCVSIGIIFNEQPVIGVINAPVHREIYAGAKGQGATLNGAVITVDPSRTVQNAVTGIGSNAYVTAEEVGRLMSEVHRRGGNLFRNGSGALMLAYVAAGRLVGYYEPYMHAWDCAAGFCLAQEAGAYVYPFPMNDEALKKGNPVFVAAPGAADELLGIARLSRKLN